MATGVRVGITLACTECKRRNYQTNKSKRNDPDRNDRRDHRVRHRRRVPLGQRPRLAASRRGDPLSAMFRWYVVNTYSGHENKVKANLEHRIDSMNARQSFRRVVVPTEQVIETKDGQKVQTEKRILPGYVLVNMDLNDDSWTVVKNTP